MSIFDIYVHGTPRGHQIWGSEHSHDYISTFYNHDTQASEKVVLQIEICGGDAFYTYLRHQNVFDVEGRPQAFFALTVGFRKVYCTNVYRLYHLFDAIYNQICVGSILKQDGGGERYLVADLKQARSGVNATVEKIQAAFTQNLEEHIVPTLQPLSSGDTFNKTKKMVSLLEVDSPLFFDYFKKNSVIVSPSLQPSAIAYDAVATELKRVSEEKREPSSSNEQLQSDINALTQENKSLSNQLQSSASSTEKKDKSEIDQLQSDLINVTNERDSLKQKIQENYDYIEIDQSIQKLTRLLAGRFPDNRSQEHLEDKQESNSKSQTPIWRDWLNSILLGLVLVCCCIILALVLKSQGGNKQNDVTPSPEVDTIALQKEDINAGQSIAEAETTLPTYDPWDKCYLNIKGGGDELSLNITYLLYFIIGENGHTAYVPPGKWSVYFEPGKPINNGNTFKITDESYRGKSLTIDYIVNGEVKKTRICKIKE